MRQRRSQHTGDVDMIDVTLVEDADDHDEFLDLLHELALEAIALRAHNPGDARSWGDPEDIDPNHDERPPESRPNSALRRLRAWPGHRGTVTRRRTPGSW